MEQNRSAIVAQILTELLHSGPALGEEQARLFAQRILTAGEEALVFLFLEIARHLQSSAPSPSTPSGMIPPISRPPPKPEATPQEEKSGRPTAIPANAFRLCGTKIPGAFRFLSHPEVPAANNHCEREFRFAANPRHVQPQRRRHDPRDLMTVFRT